MNGPLFSFLVTFLTLLIWQSPDSCIHMTHWTWFAAAWVVDMVAMVTVAVPGVAVNDDADWEMKAWKEGRGSGCECWERAVDVEAAVVTAVVVLDFAWCCCDCRRCDRCRCCCRRRCYVRYRYRCCGWRLLRCLRRRCRCLSYTARVVNADMVAEFIAAGTSGVVPGVIVAGAAFAEAGGAEVASIGLAAVVAAAAVVVIASVVAVGAIGCGGGVSSAVEPVVVVGAGWCKILLWDLTGSLRVRSRGRVATAYLRFFFVSCSSVCCVGLLLFLTLSLLAGFATRRREAKTEA
jgi:hypothetical protein